MIPTVAQWADIALIKQVIASRPGLAWIKPSYICAEIEIESGWDPSAVSGNSLGLMQVRPATVIDVVLAYDLVGVGPQSDPYASMLTGICYFDMCARKIIAGRAPQPLHLGEVAQAYNAGYTGFLEGRGDPRYAAKMLAQQIIWAPLADVAPPPVVVPPPPEVGRIQIPDTSHYVKITIDPASLSAPALINKTTQGISDVDPTWFNRSRDILENGKLIGGYLFATGDSPCDQINLFLTTVMGALGSISMPQLKLAIDYEPLPGNQCSLSQAEQLVTGVMAATGKRPLLYMDYSMWQQSVGSNILMACDLWLAEFGPVAKTSYKLWQYTGVGNIPGINVPCDASWWNGDLPGLTAWWAT